MCRRRSSNSRSISSALFCNGLHGYQYLTTNHEWLIFPRKTLRHFGVFDVTTTDSPDSERRQEGTTDKAAWTRPTLDVLDVVTLTQAGGDGFADQDPNQPS
jgi:hypothetical protein